MAVRFHCPTTTCPRAAQDALGHGQVKTSRGARVCAFCAEAVRIEHGVYGVFVWRGDGRYVLADALATRQTPHAADRERERRDPAGRELVVRFVS